MVPIRYNRRGICLSLFFCLAVQAGIPDALLLYLAHLPVRLQKVPLPSHIQMVHSSRLHAQCGGAHRGDRAQTGAPPALRGQQSRPHPTGLGEEQSASRKQENAPHVKLSR